MAKEIITPQAFSRLVRYEPETGKLFWRGRPVEMFSQEAHWKSWRARLAGKEAFATPHSDGYLQGKVFGRDYRAHMVVWALHHGVWPSGDIDHIDGDRTNNRIENLRDVSRSMNMRNAKMYSHNTSGTTGVGWHRKDGKWRAYIKTNGKLRHLGHFSDLDKAIAARKAAEVEEGFTERHGV